MAEQTIQPPLASASAIRAWFHTLGSTRGYDLVVRVLFICGILFLALPSAVGVATRVRGQPGAWDLALLADVLARAGVLLFFVLAAIGALGLFLQYASPWTALLMVVSLGFQLQRMRN
jgi:hypothetical protein